MSYDPTLQAEPLSEALAELREVGRCVDWPKGASVRARETYNVTCAYADFIVRSLQAPGVNETMTDDERVYFATAVYGLIQQMQEMAADLRMILDRVPSLRRAES